MSLEDALNRNSDLMEKHNSLLEQVLGKAAGAAPATAAASGADKKPGRNTRKKADDKTDDGGSSDETSGVTFADLRGKLSGWLGEFAKDEDKDNPAGAHPEVQARRDALKKALTSKSIAVKQLPEIEGDDEKIATLNTWFETKAKTADKGFGKGRLAADPEPEDDAADEDDGMGI